MPAPGAKFCHECGGALPRRCPQCSAALTPDLTEATELSAPTVRRYMDLLQQRGVATVTKGAPQSVELTPEYERLYQAPLLTTPAGC